MKTPSALSARINSALGVRKAYNRNNKFVYGDKLRQYQLKEEVKRQRTQADQPERQMTQGELPALTTRTVQFDADEIRSASQHPNEFFIIDHDPEEAVIRMSPFELESTVPPITNINDELASSKAAMDRFGVTQYRADSSSIDSYFYIL